MQHLAGWTQKSTTDESLAFITKLALSHCLEGGEQGKRIASCITSGDFLSVCDFSLDYENATTWESKHCRQAIAFFSKFAELPLGRDRRLAAIVKLKEAEEKCRVTNEIFRMRARGEFIFSPRVESIIFRAQSKIASVLGDLPTFETLGLRHGPGATTLTKKSQASAVEKLTRGYSCSEDLLPYAYRLMEEMPHLSDLHSSTGNYCRLSDREECALVSLELTNDIVDFVPKNAKTHRPITKGGSLNMMIQLAFGDYMTRRLRAFGVDLTDQERNQKLALEGSLSGNLATLDLESASDTISTEVVYALLPIDWAHALDVCRSSKAWLDGDLIKLEKFSSMGNGFTFPLESLIFWALSSCASDDGFASVYGDDIIVSTSSVPLVREILTVFGFSLNFAKSYWKGSFRESCGADYIRGIDIRPCYQKNLISPEELFRLHNFYVRDLDPDRALLVLQNINESLRIFGPDGYGDGHLIGDWRPRRHKKCWTHGYGGVIFDTFKHTGRRDKRALRAGDRVLPVYTIYRREPGDDVIEDTSDFDLLGSRHFAAFLGRRRRYNSIVASEPIPERISPVDQSIVKCPSLPGVDGYKKISIYVLGVSPV